MKLRALLAVFALLVPSLALAHPHVWVTATSTVVTKPDGTITAIRHRWTFDEPFSAYAVMGMDKDGDGKFSREELAPFAKINMESLHEYGFFTSVKQGKGAITFADPVDYWLDHDGKTLTLNFTLPVKEGAMAVKDARLEVADPSFFVAFEFAKENPVRVEGASKACRAQLKPPPVGVFQRLSQLGENAFNSAPPGGLGIDVSTPVTFSCP
jgi:ABC-type uncharacterized transport system substrate-binding protein